jgi:hypothetical protein
MAVKGLRGAARASLILGVLAAQPSPAAAQGADGLESPVPKAAARLAAAKPPYPAAVQEILDHGRRECLSLDGGSFAAGAGAVRAGDLSGDGRTDYVVDLRGVRCAEVPSLFEGTGGWPVTILVAGPGERLAEVFSGMVRDYDVSRGPGARTMTFHLHGGFCGRSGAEDCIRRHRIDDRRFEFRER